MNLISVCFGIAGAAVFLYSLGGGRLRPLLLSALSGIAAFFAADFLSGFLPIRLPLNAFTLAVSALGGLPGVMLLNILFAIM